MWVTDSLKYDDASSDPAVKGSVALLLSVCEAGQAFIKNYVLDEVEGSDGVTLSARDKKKRLTAGGLKYCRQRRQLLISFDAEDLKNQLEEAGASVKLA